MCECGCGWCRANPLITSNNFTFLFTTSKGLGVYDFFFLINPLLCMYIIAKSLMYVCNTGILHLTNALFQCIRLSPSDVAERKAVWIKLSSILSTYENLYLTDQVYLVEALEHVQFGQLTAAANVVQRLTRDALETNHKLVRWCPMLTQHWSCL